MMTWKDYEQEILSYFTNAYPGTSILFNQMLPGQSSHTDRQIDILIEGTIAGQKIKIMVDCKHFSRKIDVKDVESFAGMVEDVGVHQGIMITNKGYSVAAINRAFYTNRKIELDVINFDEMKEFQGTAALPYSGDFGVMIQAPFGWMVDLKEKMDQFPVVFQRGSTFKKAMARNEWIYFQIFKKPFAEYRIEDAIANQNHNIYQHFPNATPQQEILQREDGKRCILKTTVIENQETAYVEVVGYIDLETHLFIAYLITPKELLARNQRKLEYLLATIKIAHLIFDNTGEIASLLSELEKSTRKKDKADLYHHLGVLYIQMKDVENGISNFKKAVKLLPTHSGYLTALIHEELKAGNMADAFEHSRQLFETNPKNPAVADRIIEIFMTHNMSKEVIKLFLDMTELQSEPEILGNLFFHLGQFEYMMRQDEESMKHMVTAKENFQKVFPPDHPIFKEFAKLDL